MTHSNNTSSGKLDEYTKIKGYTTICGITLVPPHQGSPMGRRSGRGSGSYLSARGFILSTGNPTSKKFNFFYHTDHCE